MTAARYRVLFELGEGGTATVHLALAGGPGGFNKLVVLKALRRALARDADMRRLFLQEATISARFNHPNIVQAIEVLEQDELPMIVLEYLDGQTLEHVTQASCGLPLGVHLHAITRVLRALEYAHDFVDFDGTRIEIVHRDISPHNVMLTYEGHVKLLDFGIAKLLSDAGSTETGVLRGKLRYMAPEQVLGERVDRRADLFAIGVMLWQAATGEKLWRDLPEAQVLNRIANGRIPPPVLRSDAPRGLEPVILKALAPSAEDRYQTAAELNEALIPLIAQLQIGDGDRALGVFLADAFRETRDKTRAVIDAKMREVPARADAGVPVDFGTGSVPVLGTRDNTGNRSVSVPAVGPRARGGMIGAALATLVIVVLIALQRMISPSDAPARMALQGHESDAGAVVVARIDASALAVAAPVDAGLRVSLQVTAFPGDATIFVDGERVEANPHHVEVLADGAEHVVRAEAAGHETREERVILDQSRSVVIHLSPRAARRRPDARPSAGATDECNPPYYFDARGIKLYRQQCFR